MAPVLLLYIIIFFDTWYALLLLSQKIPLPAIKKANNCEKSYPTWGLPTHPKTPKKMPLMKPMGFYPKFSAFFDYKPLK